MAADTETKGVCGYKGCKHVWEMPAPAGWVFLVAYIADGAGQVVSVNVTICPEHWLKIYDSLIISEKDLNDGRI